MRKRIPRPGTACPEKPPARVQLALHCLFRFSARHLPPPYELLPGRMTCAGTAARILDTVRSWFSPSQVTVTSAWR